MKEHIIINNDRTVIVPASVYKIGNQYEHNVNKVTFDCPRYADDEQTIDLSAMKIYINYIRPDKKPLSSLAENVTVDETDPTIIHFDFRITRNVTFANGVLSFLVCIKSVNSEGIEEYHWNSDIFTKLTVGEGIENEEVISEENSDLITKLLLEVDTTKAEVSNVGDRIDSVDRKVGVLGTLATEDKSSVVAAVNEVKEASDELKSDISDLYDKEISVETLIENTYILPNGKTDTSNGSCATDFIEVKSGRMIAIDNVYLEGNRSICMYDYNKKFVPNAIYNTSEKYFEITIPLNVCYIRVTGKMGTDLVIEYKDDVIKKDIQNITASISDCLTKKNITF